MAGFIIVCAVFGVVLGFILFPILLVSLEVKHGTGSHKGVKCRDCGSARILESARFMVDKGVCRNCGSQNSMAVSIKTVDGRQEVV